MAQVINTNALSLMAQNNLNKSQSSLGTAIERLSSGLRINSAKDDAAGMAIANRFTASVRGLTQAARNANDGISLAQTTEGALGEVTENLQRIRELTVQAYNGTNSADDNASIQKEIVARLEEISRISESTNFNGVNVLDGSKESLTIQIGDKDGQAIDIKLPKMDLKALGLENFSEDFARIVSGQYNDSQFSEAGTVRDTTKAFDVKGESLQVKLDAAAITAVEKASGIAAADLEIRTAEDDKGNTHFYAVDKTNGGASEITATFKTVKGTGGAPDTLTLNATGMTATKLSALDADVLANGASTLKDPKALGVGDTLGGSPDALTQADVDKISADLFAGKDAETSGLRIFQVTGSSSTKADLYYAMDRDGNVKAFTWDGTDATDESATELSARDTQKLQKLTANGIEQLDNAMTKVTNFTADLGAVQNRFNSIIANLNTTVINTSEARSRIQDADFSVEVSAMSRSNILQQAGISVLSQANQVPQNVLSLLR